MLDDLSLISEKKSRIWLISMLKCRGCLKETGNAIKRRRDRKYIRFRRFKKQAIFKTSVHLWPDFIIILILQKGEFAGTVLATVALRFLIVTSCYETNGDEPLARLA